MDKILLCLINIFIDRINIHIRELINTNIRTIWIKLNKLKVRLLNWNINGNKVHKKKESITSPKQIHSKYFLNIYIIYAFD